MEGVDYSVPDCERGRDDVDADFVFEGGSICGCGIGTDRGEEEELVAYRRGFAEGRRK